MATKEFSKLHSAQVNKYLGRTQFQIKIENLTVKDYARGAIRSGSDGKKIFNDFTILNESNDED